MAVAPQVSSKKAKVKNEAWDSLIGQWREKVRAAHSLIWLADGRLAGNYLWDHFSWQLLILCGPAWSSFSRLIETKPGWRLFFDTAPLHHLKKSLSQTTFSASRVVRSLLTSRKPPEPIASCFD
jgi:hypothetical protein